MSLNPKGLWKYFYELTKIPRPSEHEQGVIEFLKNFAITNNLEYIIDEAGNVIIRKEATEGMKDCKGVILQSHMDMVPQCNSDKKHDFKTDPIEAYIDGEWVKANGTTLGADNGIGLAATLAILEDKNIQHGPIEALFTRDEEAGMTGARQLKPEILKGDILLNLDSEDEGQLFIGCAGGIDVSTFIRFDKDVRIQNDKYYRIAITGLKGGHSGVDINLGRANANKLMFRVLYYLLRNYNVDVLSLNGGTLRNAIPREAFMEVGLRDFQLKQFFDILKKFEDVFKKQYTGIEDNITITVTEIDPGDPPIAIDKNNLYKAVRMGLALPHGVHKMSNDMENLVETSCNLATVKTYDVTISINLMVRSADKWFLNELLSVIESPIALAQATYNYAGEYPGWKPNQESPILGIMKDIYKNKFGKTPEVTAIHAGLECGIFTVNYPHLDMISFGPTIRYPHSPDEKVEIKSVEKFWDYLVETLKNIPKK